MRICSDRMCFHRRIATHKHYSLCHGWIYKMQETRLSLHRKGDYFKSNIKCTNDVSNQIQNGTETAELNFISTEQKNQEKTTTLYSKLVVFYSCGAKIKCLISPWNVASCYLFQQLCLHFRMSIMCTILGPVFFPQKKGNFSSLFERIYHLTFYFS